MTTQQEFKVIERGRTTGYIYTVSVPLSFQRAERLVYELREISKIGGHDVTCWFVVPNSFEA